jgi:hypothetical protein
MPEVMDMLTDDKESAQQQPPNKQQEEVDIPGSHAGPDNDEGSVESASEWEEVTEVGLVSDDDDRDYGDSNLQPSGSSLLRTPHPGNYAEQASEVRRKLCCMQAHQQLI